MALHWLSILSLILAASYSFAKSEIAAPLPLGQLLIVGFKGTELTEGLDEVIRDTKPGAILLFSRNVKSAEQIARLNFNAQMLSQKVSKSPLLIAIDQEGGNVIRIRNSPTLPSALAISRTRDLTVARRAGSATGRLLKSLGINVNLAPVVDVSDPDTDKFLGTRSFGNDASRVARMTTALAMGLQENGVLPIAKHFPGHGNASGDSHLMASTNASDREKLLSRDLLPYISLAKFMKKPWGAMLAHVSFPAIDESGAPATFSKPIVGGLLRKEVSASALVMTDDIEMAGAGAEVDVGQRAVRAIDAGADMVMIAWSRKIQKKVLIALTDAVASGRLKRSRVEEALRHVARAKSIYASGELKLASKEELTRSLKNPEFTMLGQAVLRAAARNLEERRSAAASTSSSRRMASSGTEASVDFIDDSDISPEDAKLLDREVALSVPARLKPGSDPVIVLSARHDFLTSFKERAIGFNVKTAVLKPSRKAAVERFLRANPESPVFVYVSGHQVAAFVSELDDALTAKMILINIETKASIEHPEHFRDIFEVHYRHPELGAVVAESYLELTGKQTGRK